MRRFMCSEMKIVWKERQILDKYVFMIVSTDTNKLNCARCLGSQYLDVLNQQRKGSIMSLERFHMGLRISQ